jgi:alpha-1,6-mannosyltransferase
VKKLTGLDWRLLLLASILLGLSFTGAVWVDHFDDPSIGYFLLLQSLPYALAAWLVLREGEAARGRRALITILLVAVAMRLVLLPELPVSTDLYRYIWDGRIQGAGVNPYLLVPADPALASLRDGAVYPYINRADYAPSIYPPASQIIFYLVTRVSESPIAIKVAMLVFEAIAVWALLHLLAARNLPCSRILLYAWHPLPVWEFARSGHLDIIAIAFLLLAFVAADRRSPIIAGISLGAAVLVKYFPAIAAPALYRRWDWKLPVACLVTMSVLYLPYIGAGAKVLGFLGGYFSEEGFAKGSGFFLWQLLQLLLSLQQNSMILYFTAAMLVMLCVALLVLVRQNTASPDIGGAMLLAVTFTILSSPHYTWYFAWLIPFLCLYPTVAVLYLTCAAGYLYFAHWPPTLAEGGVIYGPCAVLLCAEFAFRRRRKWEERHGNAVAA